MRRFRLIFHQCDMVIVMQDTRNLLFTNHFLFILLPFSKFFNSFCSSALFLCICSYKRRWKNTHNYRSLLRFHFNSQAVKWRGSKVLFLRPSLYFFFCSLSREKTGKSANHQWQQLNFDWSSSAGGHYSHYALTAAETAFLFKAWENPFLRLFFVCFSQP